jgi:aspartate carbamoyltransferase
MIQHPFLGRSLSSVGDFNRSERLYLYEQTRLLKETMGSPGAERFRINDGDFGMYEIFLEDSTRTRESFKNAALFHRIKFSELHTETSSFNKKESYADTIANLVGYDNRVFVLRTPLEGVCRHLAEATEGYRTRHGLAFPVSFINAGDGRHEHPTQELLDEFTFLEDLDWSAKAIHLALVGDLYHGRTVHSKVYGLDLFSSVRIDLVAPPELAMPKGYIKTMEARGFRVRQFPSIADYLSEDDIAPQWYFTRPQLERMGDRILRRQEELRRAITFTPDLITAVPGKTRFYHPLPRHREFPTIPKSLDETHLNGWERQSANGYLVRIVLLAMIAGTVGDDYGGPTGNQEERNEPVVRDVPPAGKRTRQYSEGIQPIRRGLVVDHICVGDDPREIRRHMTTIQTVAGLHGRGGEWVSTGSDGRYKGLLFRPDLDDLPDGTVEAIAAVAPGSTINIVRDGEVFRKLRLQQPPQIRDIPGLHCRNPACITNPEHGEHILPTFVAAGPDRYRCEYCSTDHNFKELWK